jgi:hypothetical protein
MSQSKPSKDGGPAPGGKQPGKIVRKPAPKR